MAVITYEMVNYNDNQYINKVCAISNVKGVDIGGDPGTEELIPIIGKIYVDTLYKTGESLALSEYLFEIEGNIVRISKFAVNEDLCL